MIQENYSRRDFLKIAGLFGAAFAAVPALSACSSSGASSASASASASVAELNVADWEAVLAEAKGQTVSWYGWGGDQARNNWITEVLAPRVKELYGVTLNRVDMDINDILTQLSGEIQAGKEDGSIDFIWINGENFFSCKDHGYLWGPFATDLPNFKDYVDGSSPANTYDFGTPIEGFEAPYGKTQMQLWCDGAKVSADEMPTTIDKFTAFVKAHPGQVTYPEPGDFTGTAFIESLIAGVIGPEKFSELSKMDKASATEEAIAKIIQPGLDYLKEIAPYLWKEGKTYPADSSTLTTMYNDGEVLVNMGYGAPVSFVKDGTLPQTTTGFVFDSGTVGNQNFNAIAANSAHKAGALVCINEIISPEMQLSRYEVLGELSPLDATKLPEDIQKGFASVELVPSQIPMDKLTANALSEASGPAVPIIESLWAKTVLA